MEFLALLNQTVLNSIQISKNSTFLAELQTRFPSIRLDDRSTLNIDDVSVEVPFPGVLQDPRLGKIYLKGLVQCLENTREDRIEIILYDGDGVAGATISVSSDKIELRSFDSKEEELEYYTQLFIYNPAYEVHQEGQPAVIQRLFHKFQEGYHSLSPMTFDLRKEGESIHGQIDVISPEPEDVEAIPSVELGIEEDVPQSDLILLAPAEEEVFQSEPTQVSPQEPQDALSDISHQKIVSKSFLSPHNYRIGETIPDAGKVELCFGVTIYSKELLAELARLSHQSVSELEEWAIQHQTDAIYFIQILPHQK